MGLVKRTYSRRLADDALDETLSRLPAVSLVGPRASGKTTTASRHVASVVHLDRPAEAEVFRADPDAALARQPEPVLLDEWQEVPQVLGAVKRSVDADASPGRFVLAGSVRAEFEVNAWPGTGRIVRLPMFPLTQREIAGTVGGRPSFVQRLSAARPDAFAGVSPAPNIIDYVTMAVRGGFPDPVLTRGDAGAQQWLAGYVDELTHRDAQMLRAGLDASRFASYIEAVAANTAGVVDDATILDAAHVNRRTGEAYWHVLEGLFVTEAVPAWWSSRLTRLVALPKRYFVDTSLVVTLARLSLDGVLRDIDWVGRLLDTWVAMQLRPELALSPLRPRLHHLRTKAGQHEVDLLVEFGDGRVAAVEVKATAAPRPDDIRHLAWLRDQLGERFLMGVVLHTGPYDFALGDRVVAAPLSTLWA